ncbi:MAG: sugar phosphorylase [Actinomycetota bacterium]|nr:sugar phosphorylase [Actinomycetota bacterium]
MAKTTLTDGRREAETSEDTAPPGELDPDRVGHLRGHLERLYGPDQATAALERFVELLRRFAAEHPELGRSARPVLFDETDVILITYADQVRESGRTPLYSLWEFLSAHVAGAVTGVHLLPFYPSTSDDGFAVADYLRVDPDLGDWDDVRRIAGRFRLMVDGVFNHTSSSNPWFLRWLDNDPAYEGFFVTADPDVDLSTVTRPRASPLLTAFQAVDGVRHVWTTFSPDQVDLNYANPEVLLAVTDVLLQYVAKGARVVRLDAAAYLWKEVGTCCAHLANTHEIVRLWRTVVDTVAPGTLLITETNVPHVENVSYFGDGTNEAHLVYQFPLAPLVLSTFHLADSRTMQGWAATLTPRSQQTAFLNFLGSHDGVGIRPAEGLLTPAEIDQLCQLTKAHGGGVSHRLEPDGSLSPYELNTVYFDALTEVDSDEPRSVQVARFLSAHSILLALAGVPAIYVQSLLGSRNWVEGVEETGRLRAINRRKLDRAQLEAELEDPATLRHQVLTRLRDRIRARTGEPAFHPNGPQWVLATPPGLFALERSAPDGSSRVLCVHSVSGRDQTFDAGPQDGLRVRGTLTDLCDGSREATDGDGRLAMVVPAYGVRWLRQDAS